MARKPTTRVSEYAPTLPRRDKAHAEREAFVRLRVELTQAFSAPDSTYRLLTAVEVIGRNQAS